MEKTINKCPRKKKNKNENFPRKQFYQYIINNERELVIYVLLKLQKFLFFKGMGEKKICKFGNRLKRGPAN